jgi:hypothetical protein
MVKTNNMGYKQIPANTGKFLPVSVFGVPNTGIPVSVYTGLETLIMMNYLPNDSDVSLEYRYDNIVIKSHMFNDKSDSSFEFCYVSHNHQCV